MPQNILAVYAQFVAITVRRHTHSLCLFLFLAYFYKYLIWRTGAINEAGGKREKREVEAESLRWLFEGQGQGQRLCWDKDWEGEGCYNCVYGSGSTTAATTTTTTTSHCCA